MFLISSFLHIRNACLAFFLLGAIPIIAGDAINNAPFNGYHKDCPDQLCGNVCGLSNCQNPINENIQRLIDLKRDYAQAIQTGITSGTNAEILQLIQSLEKINCCDAAAKNGADMDIEFSQFVANNINQTNTYADQDLRQQFVEERCLLCCSGNGRR